MKNRVRFDRAFLIKNRVLNQLVCSIIYSQNISIKYKVKSIGLKKKKRLSFRLYRRGCIVTGRNKSVSQSLDLNRNSLNRLLILNEVNNFRINNW